jgi:hypothetical protein
MNDQKTVALTKKNGFKIPKVFKRATTSVFGEKKESALKSEEGLMGYGYGGGDCGAPAQQDCCCC